MQFCLMLILLAASITMSTWTRPFARLEELVFLSVNLGLIVFGLQAGWILVTYRRRQTLRHRSEGE